MSRLPISTNYLPPSTAQRCWAPCALWFSNLSPPVIRDSQVPFEITTFVPTTLGPFLIVREDISRGGECDLCSETLSVGRVWKPTTGRVTRWGRDSGFSRCCWPTYWRKRCVELQHEACLLFPVIRDSSVYVIEPSVLRKEKKKKKKNAWIDHIFICLRLLMTDTNSTHEEKCSGRFGDPNRQFLTLSN